MNDLIAGLHPLNIELASLRKELELARKVIELIKKVKTMDDHPVAEFRLKAFHAAQDELDKAVEEYDATTKGER